MFVTGRQSTFRQKFVEAEQSDTCKLSSARAAATCHLSLQEQFGSSAPGARDSPDDKAEMDIYLVRHLNSYFLHPYFLPFNKPQCPSSSDTMSQ